MALCSLAIGYLVYSEKMNMKMGFALAMILFVIHLIMPSAEGFTSTISEADLEAIQNVASLYDDGTITIDALNVTKGITANTVNAKSWLQAESDYGDIKIGYGQISVGDDDNGDNSMLISADTVKMSGSMEASAWVTAKNSTYGDMKMGYGQVNKGGETILN